MGNELDKHDKDGSKGAGAKGAAAAESKGRDTSSSGGEKQSGTRGRSLIKPISGKGKGSQAKNSSHQKNKEGSSSNDQSTSKSRDVSAKGGAHEGKLSPKPGGAEMEQRKKRKVMLSPHSPASEVKQLGDGTKVINNNNSNGKKKKLVVVETSQVVEEKSEIVRPGSKTPSVSSDLESPMVENATANGELERPRSDSARMAPVAAPDYISPDLCRSESNIAIKSDSQRTSEKAEDIKEVVPEPETPSDIVCDEISTPGTSAADGLSPNGEGKEDESFNTLSFWRKHVPPLTLADIAQVSTGSQERDSPSTENSESATQNNKAFREGRASSKDIPTPEDSKGKQHHFRMKYSPDDLKKSANLAGQLSADAKDKSSEDSAAKVEGQKEASGAEGTPSQESGQLKVPTILKLKETAGDNESASSTTNTPGSEMEYFDCHSQADSVDNLLDDVMQTPEVSPPDDQKQATVVIETPDVISHLGMDLRISPSGQKSELTLDSISSLKRKRASPGKSPRKISDRTAHNQSATKRGADVEDSDKFAQFQELVKKLPPPTQLFTFSNWKQPPSDSDEKKIPRSISFDEVSFFGKSGIFSGEDHNATPKTGLGMSKTMTFGAETPDSVFGDDILPTEDGLPSDLPSDMDYSNFGSLQRPKSLFKFTATPYDRTRAQQWRRVERTRSDSKMMSISPGRSPKRALEAWSPRRPIYETPEKERQARLDFKINFKEQSNFSGESDPFISL